MNIILFAHTFDHIKEGMSLGWQGDIGDFRDELSTDTSRDYIMVTCQQVKFKRTQSNTCIDLD